MAFNENHPAPWSRQLAVVTGVATLLVGGISLAILVESAGESTTTRLAGVLLPWAAWLACAPFLVRGYRIAPGMLLIERAGWRTRLPLAGLREAYADPQAMDGSLRLFANGGAFVFAGLFRSRRLGNYRAWVNDPARAVVLRFDERTCVVSPADPQAFVRAVMAAAR